LDYLATNPSSPFTDQDALNVACDTRWKSLDPRWNFQSHRKVVPEQLVGDGRPFVIHFVTFQKPWNADSFSAYARMYDRFRSRTAYRRTRLDELSDLTSVAAFHCKHWLKQYRVVRWALAHRLARH
jgi:lipopolysaccharide biosynthesis glycosyltransferase